MLCDLPIKQKEETLAAFSSGTVRILVCTTALSAGYDTAGVKNVVFYTVTPQLNAWVQIAGRGARNDGEVATVHVFWQPSDFGVFAYFYKNTDENDRPLVLKDAVALWNFYTTPDCKRTWLSRHYGFHLVEDCGQCSSCLQCTTCHSDIKASASAMDITAVARAILERLPPKPMLLTDVARLLRERTSNKVKERHSEIERDRFALPMAVRPASDAMAESILVWMVHTGHLEMEAHINPTDLNFCAMVRPSMTSDTWLQQPNCVPIVMPSRWSWRGQLGGDTVTSRASVDHHTSLDAVRKLLPGLAPVFLDKEHVPSPTINTLYVGRPELPYSYKHSLFHNANICHGAHSSHNRVIDLDFMGSKRWEVLSAPCKGVKVCNAGQCKAAPVSANGECNHGRHRTTGCPCKTYSFWARDSGVQMMLVIAPKGVTHNHPEPYRHKYNAVHEEAISQAVRAGYTKDAISVGRGVGFVPVLENGRYATGTHLSKVIQKATRKVHENTVPNALFAADEAAKMMRDKHGVPKAYPYVRDWDVDGPLLMCPLQSQAMTQARFLEVDTQYPSLSGYESRQDTRLPYCTNWVAYDETLQKWAITSRFLHKRVTSTEIQQRTLKMFLAMKKDNPEWKMVDIETIVLDFSLALKNGVADAIRDYAKEHPHDFASVIVTPEDAHEHGTGFVGDANACELHIKVETWISQLFRGCKVHWLRSVNRVAKCILYGYGEEAVTHFKSLCQKIPNNACKEEVQDLFASMEAMWPALGGWCTWWKRPHVLQVLSFAYTNKSFFEWLRNETSNGVESHNRPLAALSNAGPKEVIDSAFQTDLGYACKFHVVQEDGALDKYAFHLTAKKTRQIVNNCTPTVRNGPTLPVPSDGDLWRDHFDDKQWLDGKDRYQGRNVVAISVQHSREKEHADVSADVGGRQGHVYKVQMEVDFGMLGIKWAVCHCPSTSSRCKHMAAALFAAIYGANIYGANIGHENPVPATVAPRVHAVNDYRPRDVNRQIAADPAEAGGHVPAAKAPRQPKSKTKPTKRQTQKRAAPEPPVGSSKKWAKITCITRSGRSATGFSQVVGPKPGQQQQ